MVTTLDIYKQNFVKSVSGLKNYDKMSETELANGYCDALDSNNKELSDQYYAALMLRYWYKIYKYKETCKSTRLEDEDFINWLNDALNIAFRYRDWRNPNKPISKDPKAVDKIINRCCFSIRGYYYQEFNKNKRKINYLTDSIENQLEVFGDAAEVNLGIEEKNDNWLYDFIKSLINKNKIEEAIVVDNIAYQDSLKETTNIYYLEEEEEDINYSEEETKKFVKNKYSSTTFEFDKKKLKKSLINLDDMYYNYFQTRYGEINFERLKSIKNFFNKVKDKQLYSFIDMTLNFIKLELKELI